MRDKFKKGVTRRISLCTWSTSDSRLKHLGSISGRHDMHVSGDSGYWKYALSSKDPGKKMSISQLLLAFEQQLHINGTLANDL